MDQAVAHSFQELFQARGVRLEVQLVKNFLGKIDSCCPWFKEEETLDCGTWEKVGEALKITQADNFTLGLWALVNDAIKDATSPGLSCPQAELVVSQEECLSERASSEKDLLNSKIDKCGNSDEKLIFNKNHSDRGAAHYLNENWSSCESPAPPVVPTSGGATHRDTRLSELEFEIKLQRLTNELRELKKMSEAEKSNSSVVHQVPLEKVVSQARGKGQNMSNTLAFPVVEVVDQQDTRGRHYQTLDFKLIKELKAAVVQYGPSAPFTQALLDTVVESHLTPLDWKTLSKATLSGGDFLLWDSEWRDASKKTAASNAQAGNSDWDSNMLLGEGPYEGQTNQIDFPVAVYAQIATAARRAWGRLPVKGEIGGSLASIRQSSDEPYQDFVDRLLISASRILGNPDTGSPFVMQLAYENANAICRAAIQPHKGTTDLAGYVCLCADIGPSCEILQGTHAQAMFSRKRGKNVCFKCGSLDHFRIDCPQNKGAEVRQTGRAPGICPRCGKGHHWAKECKHKPGVLSRPVPGNEERGQPQAPSYSKKTAYGAINLLPSQQDQFLSLSGQTQEMQDWTSVPLSMQH